MVDGLPTGFLAKIERQKRRDNVMLVSAYLMAFVFAVNCLLAFFSLLSDSHVFHAFHLELSLLRLRIALTGLLAVGSLYGMVRLWIEIRRLRLARGKPYSADDLT
jgi:predicted signal transduction protein with EAL and GGDEF domain